MRTVLSIMCGVALTASVLGCDSAAPYESIVVPVTNVEAPATVAANATFTVTLTVQVGGCTKFDHIAIESDANAARLIPWGKSRVLGPRVICTENIAYETHAIELKAGGSDPFVVDVDQGRLAPIRTTVRVQ